MMQQKILEEGKSYTFSDYLKLPYSTKNIVAEFGYQFQFEKLELPRKTSCQFNFERLQTTFYQKLPYISLNSEAAKREFFISPLLLELLDYVQVEIETEYLVNINDQLKGNIDYLIRSLTASTNELIVIEAKNGEMDRGFTQLAMELIAIDRSLDPPTPHHNRLYGVITIGNVWQFGSLNRSEKLISKNIDVLAIPAEMESLFEIFLGILE